jgi:hypothetical protein
VDRASLPSGISMHAKRETAEASGKYTRPKLFRCCCRPFRDGAASLKYSEHSGQYLPAQLCVGSRGGAFPADAENGAGWLRRFQHQNRRQPFGQRNSGARRENFGKESCDSERATARWKSACALRRLQELIREFGWTPKHSRLENILAGPRNWEQHQCKQLFVEDMRSSAIF